MTMIFYVKVKAHMQGTLAGDSTKDNRQDWMTGLAFRYEVRSPSDAATGMPTGRRQYSVSFVKAWGKSSPQLMQASISNEALDTVTFEFVLPGKINDPKGKSEKVFQRITLKQATVRSMRQSIQDTTKQAADDASELEEIELAFQGITLENVVGGTVASDGRSAVDMTTSSGLPGATGTVGKKQIATPPVLLSGGAGAQSLLSGGNQVQLPSNANVPKWGRFAPTLGPSGGAIG